MAESATQEQPWNAIPWDVAVKRLSVIPDYDPGGGLGPCACVHTISAHGIGAYWPIADLQKEAEQWGCIESGATAKAMAHGLVIMRPISGPLFLETVGSSADD
jgi:hypothetical protein